jgi:L-ascorbate metabolism protein UlaG (beta-lactamase superfamily)
LPLLSAEPSCAPQKWEGSGVRINYLGHACVLIEWNGISILTDPCIALKPVNGGVERFTYKDLPEKLDYVLITHNHHDHFCLESLLRLRHKIDCLVVPRSFGMLYGDLSLKLLAKKVGFRNVVELETLESIKLPDGEIIAIPFMGEHADLSHGKTAYVVRAGSTQTLFAADSDCLDVQMYQHIHRVLGPIQTVFLGMECVGAPLSWSCGAFLPCKPEHSINQSRRYKGCDSTRGLRILEAVGAQRIYIYAMGLEPWLEHLLGLAYTAEATQIKEAQKLLSAARERGFSDAQLLTNKAEIHLMNHA